MKRPFLVASDLRPCMPVDETQRKNGDSTDWDRMDVILRAYRCAMILAGKDGDIEKEALLSYAFIISPHMLLMGRIHLKNSRI